jgi:hypothetical protein
MVLQPFDVYVVPVPNLQKIMLWQYDSYIFAEEIPLPRSSFLIVLRDNFELFVTINQRS